MATVEPLLRSKAGGVFHATTKTDLHKIAQRMFLAECLLVPVFYRLGRMCWFGVASIGAGVFLLTSVCIQYRLASSPVVTSGSWRYQYEEPLKTVMGVPVGWTGLKQWQWHLVVLAPNSVHMLSTVIAVGGWWELWHCKEVLDQEGLRLIPVVGSYAVRFGLLGMLTRLLILHFLIHFIAICISSAYTESTDGVCDGANLLFLARLHRQPDDNISCVRILCAPLTYIPMLWCEVWLLAVGYEFMTTSAICSMLIAIALAFYTVVLLAHPFVDEVRRNDGPAQLIAVLVLFLFAFLLILISSTLVGIWVCTSHYFSYEAAQCTNVTERNITNCTLDW